jgi:L-lactate dehydrogenase (cytochrome)
MAGMYSSRGEVKAANAAKAVGVPFTLSTMGVCDVHEVAQKTGPPPWLHCFGTDARTPAFAAARRKAAPPPGSGA